LTFSDNVGLVGTGPHASYLLGLAAINMMVWNGVGGDPANAFENFKIDGNNMALSGCIVGFGQQFYMRNISIRDCVNDGLVLSQTQNSLFQSVFVTGCGLSNYRLSDTAWNNAFIRCGSNAPADNGYHYLSRQSAAYNALTGSHAILSNRHNVCFHCIFEGGNVTSIISLEDDSGDNGFYEMELTGGSAGNPQVNFASGCDGCVVFHGTISSGGAAGNGRSCAFANEGFGTQIINVTGIGWSGANWVNNTTPGNVFVITPLGSYGDLNVISGGGTQTILGNIGGAFNYQLASGSFGFSENGNDGLVLGPLLSAAGDITPTTDNTRKLGNSVRKWSELNANSVTTYTAGELIGSGVSLTNNSSGQTATLTNAPTGGNPTKWIGISDNGTTRYIPVW
jgi:hypothetical protein